MEFGVAIFFTDYAMGPVELGRALEERGFESLWAPEHSHIPLSRQSPFPQGGDLPKKYYDVMDPFVTLTAAAAATTRLKVGTGICLVVQRDPIQTAKQVSSAAHRKYRASLARGNALFFDAMRWKELHTYFRRAPLGCHLGSERQHTPVHEGPRITLHRSCSRPVIPGPGLPFPTLSAMHILGLHEPGVKFLFYEFFIYALHIYVYNYSHRSFKPKLSELTRAVPCSEERAHAGSAGIYDRE